VVLDSPHSARRCRQDGFYHFVIHRTDGRSALELMRRLDDEVRYRGLSRRQWLLFLPCFGKSSRRMKSRRLTILNHSSLPTPALSWEILQKILRCEIQCAQCGGGRPRLEFLRWLNVSSFHDNVVAVVLIS